MKIIIRSVRNFQLLDDKVSEDIVREEKFSKVFLTAYFYHHDLECKKKKIWKINDSGNNCSGTTIENIKIFSIRCSNIPLNPACLKLQ